MLQRPRSGPPAKFAFLSGIHPDLDDALCEADCNSLSYHEEINRPLSRRSTGRHSNASLKSSQYYDEEIQQHQHNRKGTSSSNRVHDTRYESSQSVVSSSRPTEIRCNLNESIDSLPFSVDGMEQAKRKLKSQAARIRDLEETLQRKMSLGSIDNTGSTDRKILSPGERLEAHKERKKLENKHKFFALGFILGFGIPFLENAITYADPSITGVFGKALVVGGNVWQYFFLYIIVLSSFLLFFNKFRDKINPQSKFIFIITGIALGFAVISIISASNHFII